MKNNFKLLEENIEGGRVNKFFEEYSKVSFDMNFSILILSVFSEEEFDNLEDLLTTLEYFMDKI